MIVVIDYVFIERWNKLGPPGLGGGGGGWGGGRRGGHHSIKNRYFNFSTPAIAFRIRIKLQSRKPILSVALSTLESHHGPPIISWLCLYANYRFSSYLAWISAHARSLII